ncbi:hypothetical protein LOH54_03505 [Sulfurimonas sp. HSL-3221]|uniref:hypothetical protein n=1 Tax=Thiomicrolovo sulfuroxydans TaxID=2894755 RepID=UPI001E3A0F86|nr:hypothetical protein [Sulfurimonas sp. HSL-3221]UFS63199.1 hypothetical protein LOH54_03505 [Sulfurimonas sp. HSL-3221]
MNNSNEQVFDTVLSNNPYNHTYYLGSGNQLSAAKNPQYGKKQYGISYLNTSSFITAQIGVSKNIPDDDLAFVIETKAYEELALDMAIEYTIDFIEVPTDGSAKERIFHVFIVDPLVIDETFAQTVSALQYVDQIVPVPLLLKTLYSHEIVQGYGAHCYIYFQENDAFFTLYNEQEFVYTKSLKYSFRDMHERFCELLGEQIDLADFQTLLATEGLATQNPEYQKYLIKLFGELFLHINDVLNYAKRAYEIETIEEIYIGSQIGSIAGVDEYCQTYLGFEAKSFDFSYGFATDSYIDQIHQLMQLYVRTDKAARYDVNFSIYHRPPPFFQRHSGKLFAVTALSLVVAFAYPVTYWTMGYAESVRKALLEKQYRETHAIKVTREETINLKLAQKAEAQKLLDAEIELFEERKATLIKIHDVKVNYPMKAEIMAALTRELNRFDVSVADINYKQDAQEKVFSLKVMAKKDKQITDLVEFMTKHRTQRFHYNIEKIELDEETNYYRGDLKVVLK